MSFIKQNAKPDDSQDQSQDATNEAQASEESQEPEVIYTVHPMVNYKFGQYVFRNSVLRLPANQEQGFLAAIKHLPPMERSRIRKADMDFFMSLLGANPVASQMYDTGSERKALEALISQTGVVA